jgi:2-methylisocitrate lyase-like PEP mutase family enzyme
MEKPSLHPLLAEQKIFLSAGVYDVLSARIAERAGFSAVVLTGFGASATYLGEPDFGLLTQTEILDIARRICRAVKIPVIVDGDTGYGSALNVIRMVPRACGHGGPRNHP